MNTRLALAELTKQLIDLALSPIGAGFFAVPLLMLRWVVRFMRLGVNTARGGDDLEDMKAEYWNLREKGLQTRQRARDTFKRRY